MKKIIALFLVVLPITVYCQDEELVPSAAADVKTFFLDGGEIGAVENSVNLFTGEVSFPLSLISLPGRGGLDVSFTMSYNSNVEEIADTWNREVPTGMLGLGWSFSVPKIVVDNKMTGTRHDDVFYIMEGGAPNRLFCTNVNGSQIKYFKTENFTKWQISYNESYEYWEIIKEDGTKYLYGDTRINNGSAIEWIIHWGNWIGNSSRVDATKTQRQGLVWNLARIENRFGDAVTFEYKKVERHIKSGQGPKHTEACYLKKITDVIGRSINFIDMPKESREYYEPHIGLGETNNSDGTANSTADAYQERYEKRYLSGLEIRDTDESLLYTFDFNYDVPNDGEMTKRMLTSIVQKNKNGEAFPSIDFNYKQSGPKKGALERVVYPKGGEVVYHYDETGLTVGHSDRDLMIKAPEGYSEPQVFIGNDYVVVGWQIGESEKTVRLYVYEWDGGWKETFLKSFNNIETEGKRYKNLSIAVHMDHFGIMYYDKIQNVTVSAYHRNPEKDGWINTSENPSTFSAFVGDKYPKLLIGNDFLAVASRSGGHLYTYTWNGSKWRGETLRNEDGCVYHAAATNNYIIYHDEVGCGPLVDYIYFFYLDEKGIWNEKSVPSQYYFSSSDWSYWYPSNSFSMVMADDNDEFIYEWDVNYNFIQRYDVLGGYEDYSPVKISNNDFIGICSGYGFSDIKMARFDGVDWLTTDDIDTSPSYSLDAFGEDMFIWFEPGGSLEGIRFNPNTRLWVNNTAINPIRTTYPTVHMGNDIFFFNGGFYIKNNLEQWSLIHSIPQEDYDMWGFSSDGIKIFTSSIPREIAYPNTIVEYEKVKVYWNKNGVIYSKTLSDQSAIEFDFNSYESNRSRANNILVNSREMGSFYDESIKLDTILVNKFIKNDLEGEIIDYPVIGIEINSREDSISLNGSKYIEVEYDWQHAKFISKSNSTFYNKVTVLNKESSQSASEFGSTEYYFFNGLSSTESAEAHNSLSFNRLLGQIYKKKYFDQSGNEKAYEQYYWRAYKFPIENDNSIQNGMAYFTFLESINKNQNGFSIYEKYNYNLDETNETDFGILKSKESYRSDSKKISEQYTYLHQLGTNYDFAIDKNLLSQVVLTKRYLDDDIMDASAVKWTTGLSVNYPKESYAWKRSGNSDFDFSSASNPDWEKVTSIEINDLGQPLETTNIRGNVKKGVKYGYQNTLPIAEFSNAGYDEVFVDIFEATDLSKWTKNDVNSDSDTQWEVVDDRLKLVNGSGATNDECDRIYFELENEIQEKIIFEFDVTIAESNNYDLTIGLGGDLWTTGNEATEKAVWTAINDEEWMYNAGGTWNSIKSGLETGHTYHFRIIADPANSSVDFYVNDIQCVKDAAFCQSSTGLKKAAFGNYGYGTISSTWYIDNVRLYPERADIATYTYKPLVGKVSETDKNNQTIKYEYDQFDRMKTVRDKNNNILKHTEYQFNAK